MIKLSSPPLQLSTSYLPFYSPKTHNSYNSPSLISTQKPILNQDFFKNQPLSSPNALSSAIQQNQLLLKKPINTSLLLGKVLSDGQGLLTQREHSKPQQELRNTGSVSERSLLMKNTWVRKEQDSYDKENRNILNIPKPIAHFENKKSFFLPKHKGFEGVKQDLSRNFSRQDEISEENSGKFNLMNKRLENTEKFILMNQRLEISKNLITQQTPINSESETHQEKKMEYQEFLKELKAHKSEIVDLKNETKGLKEKLGFIETQIQETERKKKLDELNDLLNKANLENKLIRKKNKNSDLKKMNYTNTDLVREVKPNKEITTKNTLKNNLEFKKLLQKTDLSKLLNGADCNKVKLNSQSNSRNTGELQEILKRKLSNDYNQDRLKFLKEENHFTEKENYEKSNNISESLNTLKKRLAGFLNKHENKKKK